MAITDSTHLFTFGSSIGEHLSEGTAKEQSDGSTKIALNGTQSFKDIAIKPGKDSELQKYLNLKISSAVEEQQIRDSILKGTTGISKLVLDKMDEILKAIGSQEGPKAPKPNKLFEFKFSADDNVSDVISSISDITKDAEWINPFKAISFSIALRTFGHAISSALKTISNGTKGINLEETSKSLEFFQAIVKMSSETKDANIKLTSKYLSFANSKLRISPKVAKNFSSFITTAANGIFDALSVLQKLKIDPAKFSGISTILSDWIIFPISQIPKSFGKKATLFKEHASTVMDTIVGKYGLISKINKSEPDTKKFGELSDITREFISLVYNVPLTFGIRAKVFEWSISTIDDALKKLGKLKVAKTGIKTIQTIAEVFSSKDMSDAKKNVAAFAFGIATLGLTLTAFAVLTPAIMVASLGIKVFAWAIKRLTSKKVGVQMAWFVGSLAMFGLAIWAFGEVVTGESILKTVGGLALLYGAITIFGGGNTNNPVLKKLGISGSKSSVSGYKGLMYASVAIATLGLALSYGFKGVTLETAAIAAVSVASVGGAMWVWNKSKTSSSAGKNMAIAAGGIAAIGLSLQVFRLLNWKTLGIAGVALTGLAVIMLIWRQAKVSKNNAIAMAIVGGAIGAIGLGLLTFNAVTWQGALTAGLFMTAVTVNLLLLSKVGGPMAILGATALTIAGTAIFLIGKGLKNVPNDSNILLGTGLFVTTLSGLILGLGALAPIALAGAGALAIAGSSLLMIGGAISIMTKAGVGKEQVDIATYSLKSFAELFGNNKALMLKSSIGATAFLPTSATLLTLLPSFVALSKINADPVKMSSNISLLGLFVKEVSKVFGGLGLKEMAKIKAGTFAISGLGRTVKSLAEGIQAVANLKFAIWEERNGELKIVGYREFTDKDFDNVGVGLGKMVSALTGPLAEIGNKQDSIKIFGKSIPMPFGNDVSRGIKALSGLGELVGGIAEGLKVSIETGASPEKLKMFSSAFASIIAEISKPFEEIGKSGSLLKKTDAQKGVKALSGIGEVLNPLMDGLKYFTENDSTNANQSVIERFNSMISSMATDTRWTKAFSNMDKLAAKIKTISNNFNLIDLEKLTILDTLSKNMKEADDNNHILELVNAILELVSKLNVPTQTSNETNIANSNVSTTNNTKTQSTNTPQTNPTEKLEQNNDEIVGLLSQFINELEEIRSHTFKVKIANSIGM